MIVLLYIKGICNAPVKTVGLHYFHELQSPVTFRVQVPNSVDKSEWKLNGQSFTITLPLTDTVRLLSLNMQY